MRRLRMHALTGHRQTAPTCPTGAAINGQSFAPPFDRSPQAAVLVAFAGRRLLKDSLVSFTGQTAPANLPLIRRIGMWLTCSTLAVFAEAFFAMIFDFITVLFLFWGFRLLSRIGHSRRAERIHALLLHLPHRRPPSLVSSRLIHSKRLSRMPVLTRRRSAERRQYKITLGEMRVSGVRGLLIYCSDYKCSHSTVISGDKWPDHVRLSDLEARFVCRACGTRGADIRPDFNWDRKRPPERQSA